MSVGRQPLIGLILCSFQNSIILRCALTGSSLYFSCSALICGWRACIRFAERVVACVSGQKMAFMIIVMATIAHPYGKPKVLCSQFIESNTNLEKNPKKALIPEVPN